MYHVLDILREFLGHNCCVRSSEITNLKKTLKTIFATYSHTHTLKISVMTMMMMIPSKYLHFALQNIKQCTGAYGVLQITVSNTLISTCIE